MIKTCWTISLVVVGIALAQRDFADEARVDGFGNLTALNVRGEKIPFATKYKIVLPDWNVTESPNPWNIVERRQTRLDKADVWTGRFRYDRAGAGTSAYRHVLRNQGDRIRSMSTVTPDADMPVEGLFQYFDLQADRWIGATCTVSGTENASVCLPDSRPDEHHLLIARGKTITLVDAAGRTKVTIQFDAERSVTVEDYRKWGNDQFTVYTRCSGKLLRSGQPITVTYEVSAELMDEPKPATVALHADQTLYQLDGIGGNYCFNIESPTTQYTLENLKIGWARTEMTLRDWAPTSEAKSAGCAANDRAGSMLRQEFELMRQIQNKGVPYVISIWNLPSWLYEDSSTEDRSGRRVHPDRWDDLLDCVGLYLVHAKENYGAEADLFSFNEADHGVKVKITAEELPDVIKRFGRRFESLGLKTKMLLGDTTGPANTHRYCLPAANDVEAMRYTGAIALHSWGGATADQYAAWRALSADTGLPLLVTELGVDSSAYRTPGLIDTWGYAVREAVMYQDLLLHAWPRGTMQWEFTRDYGIVHEEPNGVITPTKRFWFVKHICNLTPQPAQVLATKSNHPAVRFTAFRGDHGKLVMHLMNDDREREVTITGLPDGFFTATCTSVTHDFAAMPDATASGGKATLTVPAESLTTLISRHER